MQTASQILQAAPARKPNPAHKRARFTYSVSVSCSCGWTSATWCGRGARKSANAEWLSHREKHEKTESHS